MKPFEIRWGERSWTDDDVLGSDLAAVQILIGGGWEMCDPWKGPLQLMGMIAVLECRESGRTLEDVMAEVRLSSASDVMDAIRERSPLVD